MQEIIRLALTKLDPDNSDDWTSDGLPRIETLIKIDPSLKNLKRGDITDAAPHYTKDHPSFTPPEEVKEEEEVKQDTSDEKETPAGYVEVPETDPEDEYSYDDALEALHHNRALAAQERADANEQVISLDKRISEVVAEKQLKFPPMSPAQMVAQYQKNAKAVRAQSAERAAMVRAQFGGADTSGKSKVDQAMARKSKRGEQRPKR